MRGVQADASAKGRDIGSIPTIANPERREACRVSLRLFCETYNPEAFYHGWSDDHLKVIARIEEAVTRGALFAFAMPRGSGKTTICRMAGLWAISYGLCRYLFVIGANADKGEATLDAIKTFIRFLPEYANDFPEISYPARALNGIANRASGQTCQGQSTMIYWGKDRLVLPSVPKPPNMDHPGPMAPTSGSIIGVSGLTGDGIRGSLHTLTTGEQIRPDFVLLDDPQTDESAASRSQNATRERLVAGAVLGMAGPGKQIAAVMPCTVIQPEDFVDRILDRTKHPLWRGERTKMLVTMPTRMDEWEKYFEVYRECAQQEPPDFEQANAYYRKHRKALEEGAKASWEQRKLDWEVSAIQHAMNLYCRDERAFWAEYQNEPQAAEAGDVPELTSTEIAEKQNGLKHREVPLQAEHLTAFIDVQQKALFYCVTAWGEDFTGYVVDYGVWPDQKRRHFTLRDIRKTLLTETANTGLEGAIYAGLEKLCDELLQRKWQRDDGAEMKIGRCLIDANWQTDTIFEFCRHSRHAALLTPSHGRYVGASSRPLCDVQKKPGQKLGLNWRMPPVKGKRAVRHVLFDSNWWKTFIHDRLATAMGDKGCLTLWRGDHRLFADHLTAEYRVRTEGRGRTVDEWKLRADRPDNHWLDCLVGCAVAASMTGCALMGEGQRYRETRRKRIKLSDLQRRRA